MDHSLDKRTMNLLLWNHSILFIPESAFNNSWNVPKLILKPEKMRPVGVILYRPHKGKEEELLSHLRAAFPMLRRNGFITDTKVIGLKARDGRILVIFEWTSEEAVDLVGEHPEVQEYWIEQDRISTFDRAADLPEFQRTIPVFERVEIE